MSIMDESTETGLPKDLFSTETDEISFEQDARAESQSYREEETASEEEETSDFEDETAEFIFSQSGRTKKSPTKLINNYPPIEKRLEEATSQRSYYSVCKEIEKKTQQQYADNVSNNFTFLLDNSKVVQAEYGTENDRPNGEWIIDVDEVDEETLAKEIRRLQVKLGNVNRENRTLETKKGALSTRLNDAMNANQRLENKLRK